jgi:hypothetical protein
MVEVLTSQVKRFTARQPNATTCKGNAIREPSESSHNSGCGKLQVPFSDCRRLRADDGQLFHDPVVEELPTTRSELPPASHRLSVRFWTIGSLMRLPCAPRPMKNILEIIRCQALQSRG